MELALQGFPHPLLHQQCGLGYDHIEGLGAELATEGGDGAEGALVVTALCHLQGARHGGGKA